MQPSNYGDYYAISVVAPEEDRQHSYSNALQLHNDFGHHSTGPSSAVNQARGGNHSYVYDTTSSFNNQSRPQLSQLTTDFHYTTSPMPNTPNYPTGAGSSQGAAYFYANNYPSSWVQVNEVYHDPHSPSRYEQPIDSSPNIASLSPQHIPGTPSLGVDASPSSPAFPSPGSQGSRSSLNPSPSPNLLVHPLTPASVHGTQLSPESIYDHPAIVQSSPAPQHTPLRTTHQLNSPYAIDESQYTTAQAGYNQAPAYNGQSGCGPGVRSVHYAAAPAPAAQYLSHGYQPRAERVHYGYAVPEFPADGLGPYVPQKLYKPHTSSDRRRYVDGVSLEPPILFEVANPPQQGISLRDAINARFIRLKDRDEPMFVNRGPSISVRLVWEGYPPWSRQIPTRDFKSPPCPITRWKLAKNIAKSLQRFIDDHQSVEFSPGSDPRWRVGVGHITLDDLILVSLHHVSMGSWQANLRLARPFAS